MIIIHQIQMTSDQVDAFNSGNSVPAIEAKRQLMFGSEDFKHEMFQYFTEVAKVETDDLEEAFELTNLWEDETKITRLTRMSSTSVGDILQKDDRYFMVDNFGFTEIHFFNDEIEVA